MRNIKAVISACFIITCLFHLQACKKNVPAQQPAFKVYSYSNNVAGFQAIKLANNTFAVAFQNDMPIPFTQPQDSDHSGYVLCVDADGNRLWQHELRDSAVLFTGIAATPDGGVVVGGYRRIPSTLIFYDSASAGHRVYFVHFTAAGVNDWSDTLRQDATTGSLALCAAPDGSIEAAALQGQDPFKVNLVNIAPSGNINSIRQVNVPDSTDCYPQRMTAIGGSFIITGPATNSSTSIASRFTLKTDAAGDLLWFSFPAMPANGFATSIDVCGGPDNSVIVCNAASSGNVGTFYYLGNEFLTGQGINSFDFYDLSTGAISNTVSYPLASGGSLLGFPYISPTADNGYIIAATDNVDRYLWHVVLMKTDAHLGLQWQQEINTAYPASAFGVIPTGNGYLVFATMQSFGKNKNDVAIIRTDANGRVAE